MGEDYPEGIADLSTGLPPPPQANTASPPNDPGEFGQNQETINRFGEHVRGLLAEEADKLNNIFTPIKSEWATYLNRDDEPEAWQEIVDAHDANKDYRPDDPLMHQSDATCLFMDSPDGHKQLRLSDYTTPMYHVNGFIGNSPPDQRVAFYDDGKYPIIGVELHDKTRQDEEAGDLLLISGFSIFRPADLRPNHMTEHFRKALTEAGFAGKETDFVLVKYITDPESGSSVISLVVNPLEDQITSDIMSILNFK